MPANDPMGYEGSMEEDEYFKPYPADANDKPFMTYDKLQTGAYGKPAPKQS
jgi:hypothetical protein